MKHPAYRKARIALALLLAAAALGLSACGRGAGTQVAGADQQVIYGYVLEANDQARTVTVDPVEMVAAEDVQRMNRLGLAAAMDGRSYAYNARRNFVMYALDRTAEFDFGDGDAAGGGENANLTGNGQAGDNAVNDGGGLLGGDGLLGGNDNGGDAGNGSGGSGSNRNGGMMGNNDNANGGGSANRTNSETGNTGEPGGNSVSGNTSVGNGTAYGGTAGTASDTSTNTAAGSSGNSTGGNGGSAAGGSENSTSAASGGSQSNGAGQNGGTGGSVNAGPYADDGADAAMSSPGYGYAGVKGGLFGGLSNRFDRLNAYIRQYDDLLCRLVLENGAVTKITVCTGDNM